MTALLILILLKIIGWTLFVFAAINTAATAARYVKDPTQEIGFDAFLRMLIFGASFALWSLFK